MKREERGICTWDILSLLLHCIAEFPEYNQPALYKKSVYYHFCYYYYYYYYCKLIKPYLRYLY